LKQKKCFPVFLTLKEIQNFLIYYESLIKPKMHNFVDLKDDSRFITDNWPAYVSINQKIAQKVIEVRSQVSNVKAVWVHGDHLMLVPQYIRK
jgi:trehalose-6-phosphate synthase